MTTERLTTLAAVKEWLEIEADSQDKQLIRIINAASQFVLAWLNRDTFGYAVNTQNFKGNGKSSMLLRNWPVIAVSSVGIGGSTISASTFGNGGLPGTGYTVSDPRMAPQAIELNGWAFGYGVPSQVVYSSGFVSKESYIIATHEEGDPPLPVIDLYTPVQGQWIADRGVEGPSGPFVLVNADPASGEYSVDDWGVYTFSIDDVDEEVIIDYSFVPWDISFAVTELIGEWYKRKDRIGLLSKTLGGQETVTFSNKDMSEVARSSLQPYMNVVPI